MISLLSDLPLPDYDPEDVAFSPSPQEIESLIAKALSRNYEKTKNLIFRHAMTIANGGVMPTDDEIRRNAQQVVSKDGTVRLLWGHPPIKPGDEVDLSYEIATIERSKP